MRFETKAIHAGQEPDEATGATVVPIYQTSTFTHLELGKHRGYEYSRVANPTRAALETCLAELEGGKFCAAFASGQAASMAVLSTLSPGDWLLVSKDLYGGTYGILERLLAQYGITAVYADSSDTDGFISKIDDTVKMVWLESPANPLLGISDIRAIAGRCKSFSIPLVVDNTFATLYFQNPLELGADVVVHSTTKYIGGHSDLIGGAVITSNHEIFKKVQLYLRLAGAVPGPFDCWLALRGLKTLAVRMRQHEANAFAVARFLAGHPLAEEVYYPGLPGHPGHAAAKSQMRGFGGMVALRLLGGLPAATAFLDSLRVFSLAESLGGVESLAGHPWTMSHGPLPAKEKLARGITEGTVRLSVGIEDANDLVEDLEQALDQAGRTH
jgi:cystathionine gamma-lyase